MKRDQIKYITLGVAVLLISTLNSCKKLIAINPPSAQLVGSAVYADSPTVQTTLAGLYGRMAFTISTASPYRFGITTLAGFSADELQYVGSTFDQFINNSIPVTDPNAADVWAATYNIIYDANSIIAGVTNGSGISDNFRNQAIAEAKFVRAFCYFYLINLYGDVPLVVNTDVAANALMARTASSAVYKQIITDLQFVQSTLPADYSISSNQRTRANKWVATALLAKVYLYTSDWADAKTQAAAVIGNTALFGILTDPTKVFTPSNNEAIWQFYNDNNGYTAIAGAILPNAVSRIPTYVLAPQQVSAFETGDVRKTDWTATLVYNGATYYYPYKYKNLVTGANAEYYTVLRLAEQYLIRAEAEAETGDSTDAINDLNIIRTRATLPAYAAANQGPLLAAIQHERQVELFCEWGNRWLDLKRTGTVNAVIGAEKTTWTSTAALFPIPAAEISNNSNLVQNPGY